MTEHDKNFIKWLLIALTIFIAVAVMYYQNRPIKEVEQVKEYPTYKMY